MASAPAEPNGHAHASPPGRAPAPGTALAAAQIPLTQCAARVRGVGMQALHCSRSGAPVFILAAVLSGAAALASDRPLFLVDQGKLLNGGVRVIDGVSKRVMPPRRPRVAFPLAPAPHHPLLRFSIGLLPGTEPRLVRFTVSLRRADPIRDDVLYTRDLTATGWVDDEVDLGDVDLAGATLLFEKTVLEGTPAELASAAWGNPALLPRPPRRAPSVLLISLPSVPT
jgi:hypothetical protein